MAYLRRNIGKIKNDDCVADYIKDRNKWPCFCFLCNENHVIVTWFNRGLPVNGKSLNITKVNLIAQMCKISEKFNAQSRRPERFFINKS